MGEVALHWGEDGEGRGVELRLDRTSEPRAQDVLAPVLRGEGPLERVPAGEYRLWLTRRGFLPASHGFEVRAGQRTVVELRAPRGETRIRFALPSGGVAAPITVRIGPAGGGWSEWDREDAAVTPVTDAHGFVEATFRGRAVGAYDVEFLDGDDEPCFRVQRVVFTADGPSMAIVPLVPE